MTALSVADVSAYVRSLTPMAASSRAGQLYFLREYLRFAVREHGADPVLGAMFPVIVFDRDAVLPSVYRPGEVAAALAEAGNQSESPLRDRAVLLLASLLGLRSGDIKGLRFGQIDWANRRLSLAQHKTGRRLDLPLPDGAHSRSSTTGGTSAPTSTTRTCSCGAGPRTSRPQRVTTSTRSWPGVSPGPGSRYPGGTAGCTRCVIPWRSGCSNPGPLTR